jgi:hypothetical protein
MFFFLIIYIFFVQETFKTIMSSKFSQVDMYIWFIPNCHISADMPTLLFKLILLFWAERKKSDHLVSSWADLNLSYPKMMDVAVPANLVCGIQDPPPKI